MRVVIAIASTKGGVGKTATCSGLGYALADLGIPVTLVDLDKSSSLTYGFSGLAVDADHSTGALVVGDTDYDTILIEGLPGNMRLMPGNEEALLRAEFTLAGRGEAAVAELDRRLAAIDGIILLDTPGTANQVFAAALLAADWILIPINNDADSLREAAKVLSHVHTIANLRDTPPRILGLLRTVFERGTNATEAGEVLAHQLARDHNCDVLWTSIPKDTKYRESRLAGVPVGQWAPASRIAVAYQALAGELIHKIPDLRDIGENRRRIYDLLASSLPAPTPSDR